MDSRVDQRHRRSIRLTGYDYARPGAYFITDERTLDAIRRYIENNPLRWELDRYNPAASGPDPDARALGGLLKTAPSPGRNRP